MFEPLYDDELDAARDAVKKEALRRAGIGFFEVVSGDTPAQVREKIRSLAGHEGAALEARTTPVPSRLARLDF